MLPRPTAALLIRAVCPSPLTPPYALIRFCPALLSSTHSRLHSSQPTMPPMQQPQIAAGQDTSAISANLAALLASGWALDQDQITLQKTYRFKTYTKVLDFHHTIGVRSKAKSHHPEMTSKAGSLTVHWTTHQPRGLTDKDTFMAWWCDAQAEVIGTGGRERG